MWKKIEGYPDYEVSTEGEIRSYRKRKDIPKVMKLSKNSGGYLGTKLYNPKGIGVNVNVHVIVAKTFLVQSNPNKKLVLHKDDDWSNNSLGNLYFGDGIDNCKDIRTNGKIWRKLNKKMVESIRTMKSGTNIANAIIANKFNVSRRTIDRIISNRIWIY